MAALFGSETISRVAAMFSRLSHSMPNDALVLEQGSLCWVGRGIQEPSRTLTSDSQKNDSPPFSRPSAG